MLEIYSTVHRHLTNELNSQNNTYETTHLKQLHPDIFVIHTNFKPVKFSNKPKPLRLGPYKTIQQLSDVSYELMFQQRSTFHTHRKPDFPIKPLISFYSLTY